MRGVGYILTHRRVRRPTLAAALFWAVLALLLADLVCWVVAAHPGRSIRAQRLLDWTLWWTGGVVLGKVLFAAVGRHVAPPCCLSLTLLGSAATLAMLPGCGSGACVVACVVALGVCAAWLAGAVGALLDEAVPRAFRPAVRAGRAWKLAAAAAVAVVIAALSAPSGKPPQQPFAAGWPGNSIPGHALVAAGALGAAWLATLAVRYRTAPVSPLRWFFYQIVWFLARFWHGLVSGRGRLPARGGVVLAATHVSAIDPLLLQASCRRLLRWMIAREYYRIRGLGWAYRLSGSIPVSRTGNDLASARQALRALRDGSVVAIFPHGRIRTGPDDRPELKQGAAMLALTARVPLVPARIMGLRHRSVLADWFRPHRGVRVEFDRPIDLSDLYDRPRDRAAVAEATRRLAAALDDRPARRGE